MGGHLAGPRLALLGVNAVEAFDAAQGAGVSAVAVALFVPLLASLAAEPSWTSWRHCNGTLLFLFAENTTG